MTIARPQGRLIGLDLFRGLAVAGMIVVNTPGSWKYVWWPLDHAEWNGFTPTDLVFPSFLFAVGVALGLSFPMRGDRPVWSRIARRTLALIGIGWFFQLVANGSIVDFRVYGVLVRIALCYAAAASLAILTAQRDAAGNRLLDARVILGSAIGAALLYWAIMAFVPVPAIGAGHWTPEGNLGGFIDRTLVSTHHMYSGGTDAAGNVVYDPEGLLSTLPALANVLFGMFAATFWKRAPETAIARLILFGALLTIAGLAIHPFFPLNKKLWSSSFALFTSGLSALLLVAMVLAGNRPALRRALFPLEMLGANAITAYIFSLILGIASYRVTVGDTTLGGWCFEQLHARIANPYLASHLSAIIVLLLIITALLPLHRRGMHLRL